MGKSRLARWGGMLVLLIGMAVLFGTPAEAQWQIKTEDGQATLKFGFLAQPQAEWLKAAGSEDTAQNLFLRRLRILFGGKVGDKITFFIETDSPNLGKGKEYSSKDEGDVFIQDAVFTYNFSDAFKIDTGMILTPFSYHHGQGATTLLATDYGPLGFIESKPLTARYGRDYGVMFRGYLADHFEYRAGVFQGLRDDHATVPFRYAARIAWYPFEIEKGLFYSGTYLGKKKVMVLGAGYDHQDEYDAVDVDFFLDLPVFDGDGFNLQAAYSQHDGGDFISAIPKQKDWFLETGYYFSKAKVGPFIQYSQRDYDPPSYNDDTTLKIGLAWWIKGHNANLKLSWGRLEVDNLDNGEQFLLQFQVFQF